jgi:hypothetical protein
LQEESSLPTPHLLEALVAIVPGEGLDPRTTTAFSRLLLRWARELARDDADLLGRLAAQEARLNGVQTGR